MRNRRGRGRTEGRWFAESLEDRYVPSAAALGAADLLRELGTVTQTAAARGIEATATVPAGQSVTFRFEIQTTADYTLLVRHTGPGLTLVAKTPNGPATIPVGPVGPVQALPLHLSAGTYEVTAAARGNQAVFVDWDLLLSSGVGQSAATQLATVLPPIYLQANSSASAPSTTFPSGAAPTATPEATPTTSSPAQAVVQSSFGTIASGPVGRPTLGDAPKLPRASTPQPTGFGLARTLTELDLLQTIAIQPPAWNQSGALTNGDAPLITDRLVETALFEMAAVATNGLLVAADDSAELADTKLNSPGKERISLAAISPGIVLGGVAVAIATRSQLKSKAPFLRRTSADSGRRPLGRARTIRASSPALHPGLN